MKKIKLTQNKYALVDNDDFELVNSFKWCAVFVKGKWYARRRTSKNTHTSIHSFLMNPPIGKEIDHINGDGLDNRRVNLRICTHAENTRNKRMDPKNTSGYKGVSWHKATQKWTARIKINQKDIYLGVFVKKEDALKARIKSQNKLFGEFNRLST